MDKHPETRTRIVAVTLATLALAASAWTPAFAGGNPLDSVGIEHNVYLGCLMRNGGDPGASQLRRVVEECGFNPGTSTDEFVARYSSLVETDPYQPVADRMSPYQHFYTAYQFSYFTRIDQIIATAESEAAADAMFADLENEASANLSTQTAAEQSIFAALSTARHSLRYWWQVTAAEAEAAVGKAPALRKWPGSKVPVHRVPNDQTKLRRIWKVLIVVGADLLGAAGGTLIGGPVVGAATGSGSSAGAAHVLR